MYMISMIGMAIIAVPRGLYRAFVWLVMGLVGWFISAVESACAAVSSSVSGGSAVTILSDSASDTISVFMQMAAPSNTRMAGRQASS
jgi:hypothetical protein